MEQKMTNLTAKKNRGRACKKEWGCLDRERFEGTVEVLEGVLGGVSLS